MVIGPTPPGTGVIAAVSGCTLAKSTSPTRRLLPSSSMRLMPTSITTAPGLIHSALIIRGRPTAATTMSALRHSACGFLLRECSTVTVQSAASSRAAIGLPTMLERPITTACLPDRSPRVSRSRRMQPAGVQGTSTSRPWLRPPTFSLWKPSTSLAGSMACSTAVSSMCLGSGSCTRMPCTLASPFSSATSASTSAALASAGRRYSRERMPASPARSTLLRT
ncbi:hypothetical protein D3C78_1331170 [compost metagenome]